MRSLVPALGFLLLTAFAALGTPSLPQGLQVDPQGAGLFGEEEAFVPDEARGLPLRFGVDAGAVAMARAHDLHPDYGTVWVGQWNLDKGWRDTDAALAALREAGVTPAIHLYYWGDDIHPDCFSVGCAGKTYQGWTQLNEQLAVHLRDQLHGAPAVVVLETEFNKHQVHDHEPLDGYLEEQARYLRNGYPNVTVVLGLGNWYPQAWPTWDRAAAASDAIGIQAMAGSTQDPAEKHSGLFEATLEGARIARELFGKPVYVHDVAVSSYPEPDHLGTQEQALAEMAKGLPDLAQAGVEAVVYRSFTDVPSMPLTEHYGVAERHWGLAWETGELKPGGEEWVKAWKEAKQPKPEPKEAHGTGAADGDATAHEDEGQGAGEGAGAEEGNASGRGNGTQGGGDGNGPAGDEGQDPGTPPS